ncbi:SGNH hydrolase-type esterase domain containing protein [Rhypophila decipiens]
MPSANWFVAAISLLGGTAIAAPPYAATVRTPQLDLAVDLRSPHESNSSGISDASPLIGRQVSTVARFDFRWVKRWAAIGDSYTAGIGAGKPLGTRSKNRDDWECSRWSHGWPRLINAWLSPSRRDFQYPACSGDRSVDIYEQARSLQGDLDLVVMTGGGNDLCLNALIKKCVLLAYDGETACNEVLTAAENNMKTIVRQNLNYILEELMYKMADQGIVMIMGYAPFFNTEREDCADQNWAVPAYWKWRYAFGMGLTLTKARRVRFNKLVADLNKVLKDIVEQYQVDPRHDAINIGFIDWSEWPATVGGQMCDPRSDGKYPDPKHPELLFFKPNTEKLPSSRDQLTRREENSTSAQNGELNPPEEEPLDLSMEAFYESPLYKSPNPAAVARSKLDRRAPTTPVCPGDNSWLPEIPDSYAKWFHPNEKGHGAMAAFAVNTIAYFRGKMLNLPGMDICQLKQRPETTCYASDPKKKAYVTWQVMDRDVKDFCEWLSPPANTINWKESQVYNEGTPDEFEVSLTLRNGAGSYSRSRCRESMLELVHGCNPNNPDNPQNWKHGGKWIRGNEIYEIKPTRERIWQKKPDGSCRAHNKGGYRAYKIHGRGWASDDWGKLLKKKIQECAGDWSVNSWKFEYYDKDGDNWEWEWWSTFTLARGTAWHSKLEECWNNLAVPKAAGGYVHKMKRRVQDEDVNDQGCTTSTDTP